MSKGSQSTEEELLLPLLRKIQYAVDEKLIPGKPDIDTCLKEIIDELQRAKNLEKQVKNGLAKTVRDIDEILGDYINKTSDVSEAKSDDRSAEAHELISDIIGFAKEMVSSCLQWSSDKGKCVLEGTMDGKDTTEDKSMAVQQLADKDPNGPKAKLDLKVHEPVKLDQKSNDKEKTDLEENKYEKDIIEEQNDAGLPSVDKDQNDSKVESDLEGREDEELIDGKVMELQTSINVKPDASKLTKIIIEGVGKIKEEMNEKPLEYEKNENGSVHPERWIKSAEEKIANEFVTDPEMRYNDLEPLLKQCLLYFSVFPENTVIKKRTMIYWWIGEGLIRPTKHQTAETVGEECFKMLLLNGLILPISKEHDKSPRCCKLLPEVRKMLISKAKGLFEFDSQDEPITSKCQCACLTARKEGQWVKVSLEKISDELFSLFNVDAQYIVCEKDKFSKLKSIVAIQLGRWQSASEHHIEVADTVFLDSLNVMKDLTYLSLRGISRVTSLPDSLGLLTKLLILDLRACHNLETLPVGVASLKNLTHLDVSGCSLLDRMPSGLDSLLNLQVLKGFIVSSGGINDSSRLKDLARLKNLRKISISIASGAVDDDLNELINFIRLRSLTISWGRAIRTREPPLKISLPDLEKLDLQCIPQNHTLSWLNRSSFKSLRRLYISGGKLKSLDHDGETGTWSVETLRLHFLDELEWKKWTNLRKTFPSLSCVIIYRCSKLEIELKEIQEKMNQDPGNSESISLLENRGVWIWTKKSKPK